MNLKQCVIALSASILALLSFACSSTIEEPVLRVNTTKINLEFIEPDSFTDIRPSNESRSRYQKHVLQSIETYFVEFAETLPEGQMLDVKVSDIDLAGDTMSPRIPLSSDLFDVRVIEDIYFPRIKFSYALKNKNGQVLQSEEVNLRDMNFLNRSGVARNIHSTPFPYEKFLLEEWFEDTFKQGTKSDR